MEKTLASSLLGGRQLLCSAGAELRFAHPDPRGRIEGIVCLASGLETGRDRRQILFVDSAAEAVVFEQTVVPGATYLTDEADVHILSAKVSVKFTSVDEATDFGRAVQSVVAESPAVASQASVGSASASTGSHASGRSLKKKSRLGFFGRKKSGLKKKDISLPTDFRRLSHVSAADAKEER